jgi:hypothetical protein
MRRWAAGFVIAMAWLVAQGHASAESEWKTRNVVLIVADGLRWQEVFSGAEESLISRESGGVEEVDALRREFWRDSLEERRRALLPFFWTVLAERGQLYGNRHRASDARVTNGLKFSYPGYQEMLAGFPDPRIDSNEAGPNPNVTVFEWLNGMPEFRGRVAAFATWEAFRDIFNQERSGLHVQAGWKPPEGKRTPRLELLQEMFRTTTQLWPTNTYDAFLHAALKEYLRSNRPRALFVGYGETDEWAHAGRYDLYLRSAHQFDRFVEDLWKTFQSLPEYRDKTAFVLTTDHGRGRTLADWKNHGKDVEGAEEIWIAVLGPDTPALGEVSEGEPVTQAQIAATVGALIGKDYRMKSPEAGPPLSEALRRSHKRRPEGRPPSPQR